MGKTCALLLILGTLVSCVRKSGEQAGKTGGQNPSGGIRVKQSEDSSPAGTIQVKLTAKTDSFGDAELSAVVTNQSQVDLKHLVVKLHAHDAQGKVLKDVTCMARDLNRNASQNANVGALFETKLKDIARWTATVEVAITLENVGVEKRLKAEVKK